MYSIFSDGSIDRQIQISTERREVSQKEGVNMTVQLVLIRGIDSNYWEEYDKCHSDNSDFVAE